MIFVLMQLFVTVKMETMHPEMIAIKQTERMTCSSSDPQYIPHATDCHLFYSCSPGYPPVQHTCPGTTRWSTAINNCDHAHNVPCLRRYFSSGKSSIFNELWNDSESQALINLVLSSDVVQKMENGKLDPRKFTTFLINDIYYISRGPSNYELAANRTEDDELELREALEERHKSYVDYNSKAYEYWGIVPHHSTLFVDPLEKSEIEAYSSFLRNVAQNEKPYYVLVANLPCNYLWCWLGTYFQKIGCNHGNVYCETRKFMFGEEKDPGKCSVELVNYIDKFGGEYDLEKQKIIFRQAMLYELNNFNSTAI